MPAKASDAIAIENLSSGYNRLAVLREVWLEVRKGECLAVVGPNGAGKTTLLRAISGQCDIMSGDVWLLGQRASAWKPYKIARLGVSHVPEGRGMLAGMSVRDSLLVAYRGPSKKRSDRLGEMLDVFPALKDRLRQECTTLSGGEQQMLAIGRGLMAQPRILLLDEPSQGLAQRVVDDVLHRIIAFARHDGLTAVIVEQRPELVLDRCDYGVILVEGRISRRLTASEIATGGLLEQALGHGILAPQLRANYSEATEARSFGT